METGEALNIVESVLNQYRGIKRLQEVLEMVMGAEVRLSELGNEKEAVEKEIAALAAEKKAAAKENAKAQATAAKMLEATLGKVKGMEAAQEASIRAAEDRVATLKVEFAGTEKAYAERVKAFEDRIVTLQMIADQEEGRYQAIKKSINDLKEQL